MRLAQAANEHREKDRDTLKLGQFYRDGSIISIILSFLIRIGWAIESLRDYFLRCIPAYVGIVLKILYVSDLT